MDLLLVFTPTEEKGRSLAGWVEDEAYEVFCMDALFFASNLPQRKALATGGFYSGLSQAWLGHLNVCEMCRIIRRKA